MIITFSEFTFDQFENVELTAQAVNNALKWTFQNQSLDIPVPMSNGQMTTVFLDAIAF